MFEEQALRHRRRRTGSVLDLCAAPGGKSTHVRGILPENSLLVANEVIRNRSQILAENLTKWGQPTLWLLTAIHRTLHRWKSSLM